MRCLCEGMLSGVGVVPLFPLPRSQACAILGLMVVPLAYLTVWELVHSVAAAFLTGVILVCGEWRRGWV